jgi:hypothetical protein
MTALEYKMRNAPERSDKCPWGKELEMRNVGMQCSRIALNQIEALQSNANLNYSLFIIHYSLTSPGGA